MKKMIEVETDDIFDTHGATCPKCTRVIRLERVNQGSYETGLGHCCGWAFEDWPHYPFDCPFSIGDRVSLTESTLRGTITGISGFCRKHLIYVIWDGQKVPCGEKMESTHTIENLKKIN